MASCSPHFSTWPELRDFALSLDLPEVVETTAWGNPVLKAHGKQWVWWSPYVDAAVIRAHFEEREALVAADPETFFVHPHYEKHRLILVRAGRIDPDWMGPRLTRAWREAAPKRWLKAWDAQHGG